MGNEVVQFNPSELLKQETEITDRDFYQVYDPRLRRKKKVPSARVYNNWAKEAGIKTKIVDAGCDSEKAWAHVKGWIGKEESPTLQREARVTILWKTEFESLVWDAIGDQEKKKPYTIGPDGYPILKKPEDQLNLIRQLSRIKKFGERTAVTKAEAIVEKKLLGVEYREPEEIRHEKKEVQAVSEIHGETTDKETGETFDPGSEGGNTESREDAHSETHPATPTPAAAPKRELTKLIRVDGKKVKTAGVDAAQLSAIWKAAEQHGQEKLTQLLNEIGVAQSNYLTREEAQQLLIRLANMAATAGNKSAPSAALPHQSNNASGSQIQREAALPI